MKFGLLIFSTLMFFNVLTAQNDSLKFKVNFNAQATYQTGNLNQVGIMLSANPNIKKGQFEADLFFKYSYVEVEKFTILNDTWNYGLFTFKNEKQIHPVAMFYAGYAHSIGMEKAIVSAVGIGVDILRKTPVDFLQLNVVAGFMDFAYETLPSEQNSLINAYLHANVSLFNNKLLLNYKTHAYSSFNESESFGVQSELKLLFPITKAFSIMASNNLIYNEIVELGRERFNTMNMVGINFRPY